MRTAHLSEEKIQSYALGEQNLDEPTIAHLNSCNACQARAVAYRLVFEEIEHQPKASFDFDLTALVMSQLPAPKQKHSYQLPVIFLPIVFGIVVFLFRKQLAHLTNGSVLINWLIVVCALMLFAWLLLDLYFKFRKSMKNLENTLLQH